MKHTIGVFLAVTLALGAGAARGQEKLKSTSDYFPLQEGNTWKYKSGNDEYETKVTGYEKIGDDMCAKLETRCNGKVVATEHLAVRAGSGDPKDDGVYRCAFNGNAPSQPFRILKVPPARDDTWET